jgi:hypothetical protein
MARALPSRTRDLTLYRQNGAERGRLTPPTPFRPLDGAPVASLRSRTLRPGSTSIGQHARIAPMWIAGVAGGKV